MIEPVMKDDALLADMQTSDQGDHLALWWLGQSGFLLRQADTFVLLDPYLSDSLTRKYAQTDKPHIRMTARPIDPARLNFIDVVTSSHNHTDHLDADTLKPMLAAHPQMQLVIPEANRAFVAERLDVDASRPIGLNDGEHRTVAGVTFHGIAAAHEQLERDERGRCRFMGYVICIGRWTIYHSGDTVPFDGLVDQLKPFDIDVALLPINGRRPQRRVAGNLDGEEAAALAHDIGARLAIPCHYDMFTFNTEPPHRFVAACQRLGQPHRIAQCGQRITYPP